MNKTIGILVAVVAIVAVLSVAAFSSYNSLVAMNENINGKWGQVETQLQRRADLIPNLVNTVKGFAAQEKNVIDSVTSARAKLAGAQGPVARSEANNELSGVRRQ